MSTEQDQVSHGLNLTLELRDPADMPILLWGIDQVKPKTLAALQQLHFVHFARFLPARGNTALLVITEFDGPLDPYVMDFAIAIGDVFDLILSFVKQAPHLSVRDHPREFLDFVMKNNRVDVGPGMSWDDYSLHSAYPERTVIDILGPRSSLPPALPDAQPCEVDLADVQGNILRGYRASRARHFALQVSDAALARQFLTLIIGGDGSLCPLVTSARPWTDDAPPPSYALNIGFTAMGLAALGVPGALLEKLPEAFSQGPAEATRARLNGDVGESAPDKWRLGQAGQAAVHLLVSLYGFSHDTDGTEFARRATQLDAAWGSHGLKLLLSQDSAALPGGRVHFGFVDGIAQPRIAGVSDAAAPDWQPAAGVGQFLLGDAYPGIYGGSSTSLGSMDKALCQNASFAAVRLLEQDVAAFEQLLFSASRTTGLTRGDIAAKLMGRDRDGTPLAEGERAPGSNAFDYAPNMAHPDIADDHEGARCPVGAHVRRMNPRSALVSGKPHSRRLIRRGMPYGPAWDEGRGPAAERGLFGLFFCADLARQFDFIMQQWANGGIAASGIRGTQDPIIGAQNDSASFSCPGAVPGTTLKLALPRLVTTRGSLYLLVPGLGGLRTLARGFASGHKGIAGPAFDPSAFNPRDDAFRADPYPIYAQFRRHAPVALVRYMDYRSYWVFSHALVCQVCAAPQDFPKRINGGTPGLFFMDPPRHTQVRTELNKLFPAAMAQSAQEAARQAAALVARLPQHADFDLITEYTNLVTRNVFMTMFGVPQNLWDRAGQLAGTMLKYSDAMLPRELQMLAAAAAKELAAMLESLRQRCPVPPTGPELHCQLAALDPVLHWTPRELVETVQHFALGGFLSMDFLLGSGVHRLLTEPGALQQYRNANAAARLLAVQEMQRFDAPFQMADRFAAKPTTLGGVAIPAGAKVTVVYGSANRDEAVFGADADRFDMSRTTAAGLNLVFSRDDHYCIGAPMADAVVPIALDALITGMPGLRLASPPALDRVSNPYFRAFKNLRLSP